MFVKKNLCIISLSKYNLVKEGEEYMYKYGRGMWKTIEDGNELSWAVGNGIGGYANHTVAGGASQAFHGYLVASLNAPVNRKLILTRVQEQIIIKDREYDLTS